MALKVGDVFSTSRLSSYSYVSRQYKHFGTYDDYLWRCLQDNDKIISIFGPTKSGKTTLIKKVIEPSAIIRVHGADVTSADKLWELVLSKLDVSIASKETRGRDTGHELGAEASSGGLAKLFHLSMKGSYKWTSKNSNSVQYDKRQSDHQNAIRAMTERHLVLVIDDFHYINGDVQAEVSRQLKGDLESDLGHPPFVVCSIPSRGDATTRALSELQARVIDIEFKHWHEEDLYKIVHHGFANLSYSIVNDDVIKTFLIPETLGSPHVVQDCCKSICHQLGIHQKRFFGRSNLEVAKEHLSKSLKEVASNLHYERSYQLIGEGLPTHGKARKLHVVGDGEDMAGEDVYQILLRAIAMDPPWSILSRNELDHRIGQVVHGKGPSRQSVTSVLENLYRLVLDLNPRNKVLEWDSGTGAGELILMDPLFLLYLRHGTGK